MHGDEATGAEQLDHEIGVGDDALVDHGDGEAARYPLLGDLDVREIPQDATQRLAEHARLHGHQDSSGCCAHAPSRHDATDARIPRSDDPHVFREARPVSPEQSPLLVIDDHAVMGHALAMALQLQGFEQARSLHARPDISDDELVAEVRAAGDGTVVLLDLHLGDDRMATSMIPTMVGCGAQVLVLTAEHDLQLLGGCLEAGADGVFDKAQPFDQLVETLRDAVRGETVMSRVAREELLAALRSARRSDEQRLAPFEALTPREQDVLRGLLAGDSVEAIARQRVVALSTVRSHVKGLLRKLGVNSQLAAVALARDAGWPTD